MVVEMTVAVNERQLNSHLKMVVAVPQMKKKIEIEDVDLKAKIMDKMKMLIILMVISVAIMHIAGKAPKLDNFYALFFHSKYLYVPHPVNGETRNYGMLTP